MTDHAQKEMGDVVFIGMNDTGMSFSKGDVIASVESVKATSDIIAPVKGEIIEVNKELTDAPDTLNEDPYGKGWIYRIKVIDINELDSLLDKAAYDDFALNQ